MTPERKPAPDQERLSQDADPDESAHAGQQPASLLQKHRWAVFVLPLLVYMLIGTIEPRPPGDPSRSTDSDRIGEPPNRSTDASWPILNIDAKHYPLVYTVRIALTIGAILLVLPGYREFSCHVSPLAIAVGGVGIVLWVGICLLGLEQKLLVPLGLGSLIGAGQRAALDPFEQLAGSPTWRTVFLAVRFLGLVAVVPLIEEFFLRGFVMRYVVAADWWKVPFGQAGTSAIVVGTLYGVLTHPAELFAAAVFFSLITWLMLRTRNIWDCVAAHAVTNLLLGIYIVRWQAWWLW